MPLSGSSGVNFSDPRDFHRALYAAAIFKAADNTATLTASTVAGFFTQCALRGVADDTNSTADTYKTLLSVTGRGLVSCLIGPTGLAGTPLTTFEITVDGVVTTVAITATTTGQRAALGAISNTDTFTTASEYAQSPVSVDATKSVETNASITSLIPGWHGIRALGTPCLQFQVSLLIRMKTSESNSTTTNQERQSAVLYKLQS